MLAVFPVFITFSCSKGKRSGKIRRVSMNPNSEYHDDTFDDYVDENKNDDSDINGNTSNNNDYDNITGLKKQFTCATEGAKCGVIRGFDDAKLDCGVCSAGLKCMANRCEKLESLDQLDSGKMSDLFTYLPVQFSDDDFSPSQHEVLTEFLPKVDTASEFPNVSRVDFRQKKMSINFANKSLPLPLTISFKLMPREVKQQQTILDSETFSIKQMDGAVEFFSKQDKKGLPSSGGALSKAHCNHYAAVITKDDISVYLNGHQNKTANNFSAFQNITKQLRINQYSGKVWDLRVYSQSITQTDITNLSNSCDDRMTLTSPYEGYNQYLCGVYYCIFWPKGITDSTTENIEYQLSGHDMTYEHNVLTTGMYKHGDLVAEIKDKNRRYLQLTEAYRKAWMNAFTFAKPWGNFVLHENFHAYQGKPGKGGSKFLLESTANWGGYSQRPGTSDNPLLGMYTLQPHYALYADQSSPIQSGIIDFAKGGHQYGAGIFFEYITEFVLNNWLIGDIFNHAERNHIAALYKILQESGFDMAEVFTDFASRITTWDWPRHGPGYAGIEKSTYDRMFGVNNSAAAPVGDAEVDNKIILTYDAKGTGNKWTQVPRRYMVGSWAFNAYEVNVDSNSKYTVGMMSASSNPQHTKLKARIVVYNESSGKRNYHTLNVGAPGKQTTINVQAQAGDKLYLVVTSTPPTVFSGWDAYDYQYLIKKDGDVTQLPVKVILMAGQSNMEGHNTTISSAEKLLCSAGKIFLENESCGDAANPGSTEIKEEELNELFLNTVENHYNKALNENLSSEVNQSLASFLCKAGKISEGSNCGNKKFDLTDRFFKTVSEYYYNGTNYAYGYDAFKQMSTAKQLVKINKERFLTSHLLKEQSDVNVLMFQGSHDAAGTLSLTERYGPLFPKFGASPSNYGPELTFGHYMARTELSDLILLKVVQGGTSLRVEWRSKGVEQNSNNNYTDEDLKKQSLYDKLIEKANAIKNSQEVEKYFPHLKNKQVEIVGFVWFQGWNDGVSDIASENYEVNFRNFISNLKSDLNMPNLPIVVAQSHVGEPDSLVQMAQKKISEETQNMELAITDDFTNYYHFDTASHLGIGSRMAEKMLLLLGR